MAPRGGGKKKAISDSHNGSRFESLRSPFLSPDARRRRRSTGVELGRSRKKRKGSSLIGTAFPLVRVVLRQSPGLSLAVAAVAELPVLGDLQLGGVGGRDAVARLHAVALLQLRQRRHQPRVGRVQRRDALLLRGRRERTQEQR